MGGFISALTSNSEKKVFVICNLLACGGKAKERWTKFMVEAEKSGYKINYLITERIGHATEIARREAQKGIKRICAFGGDGTLNEVLNGIIENDTLINPDIELVYLSAGSSCDVEKIFPEKQPLLERLDSRKSYLVDVCRLECYDKEGKQVVRYFLANSSIGIISQSVNLFNRKTAFMDFLKRVNIDIAALYAGIKNITEFGNMDCRISRDNRGTIKQKLKNITVFKCPYFGGGMNYGVDTTYDDGKLHVATIDAVSRFKTFCLIPSLYTGNILKKRQANYYQVKNLKFDIVGEKVSIETDGEIAGFPPCRYSLLPRFLKLVI